LLGVVCINSPLNEILKLESCDKFDSTPILRIPQFIGLACDFSTLIENSYKKPHKNASRVFNTFFIFKHPQVL